MVGPDEGEVEDVDGLEGVGIWDWGILLLDVWGGETEEGLVGGACGGTEPLGPARVGGPCGSVGSGEAGGGGGPCAEED